ncbi:putative thymidylate synthase [Microcystis phage Mwe-JY26]
MTIDVQIVADSISAHSGKRLTTFVTRYPRFIHSEVMTHRVFARNASSSRAIPIQKMIKQITEDPAMPERWGRNGKGMQDHGPLSVEEETEAKRLWLQARDGTLSVVGKMLARPEQPHKQIVNRLLEPWQHINVIITTTELTNFFALRYHADADPTIEVLARKMWEAYEASEPAELEHGQWHLPLVDMEDRAAIRQYLAEAGTGHEESEAEITKLMLKLSTARCARVSYNDHYGKRPTIAKDLELHDLLVAGHPKHASPAEHQATPDTGKMVDAPLSKVEWKWTRPALHGPLVGWCQYRKTIPGENITSFSRSPTA